VQWQILPVALVLSMVQDPADAFSQWHAAYDHLRLGADQINEPQELLRLIMDITYLENAT